MSEVKLPEGWAKPVVGDYLYLKNGFAFKSNNYVQARVDTFPVIRISDLDGQNASDIKAMHVEKGAEGFEVLQGDLLIAMSGATTGKVGVYKGKVPAYQNQRVGNLKLHSEKYGSNKYKNYLISALSDQFLKVAYGGAQPNISGKAIEEMDIALPPLAEQKVIADKLDTLLAQVGTTKARLERIPEILKTFRQSVLAAAVSGKLTEEWREDRKPISPCFNTILERKESLIKSKAIKKDLTAQEVSPPETYVNGWLYLKLKSLASKITDGEHKTPKREENGRYLLSARNIQDGFITVSNVDYVGEEEYQKLRKRCDPNKGDLLISCSGSVGRVCLVDNDDMYVMVRSAALVRTIEDFVNEKYLMYFLQSPDSQKNIEESSKSTAQSNLFLGPIKDLEIALPSIEEQSEIVRRVEELFAFADTIEQKAAAALERVNNLTQSILAKAFRGELTADWRAENPDLISGENSAEALLAKIQAERDKLALEKKAANKTRKKKA